MNRIFILALDGTPFTFLKKAISEGKMPNFARLTENADFRQMDSVIPPISSVAWASFMTGKTPAEHGIFGFVERDPETMEWFVPLSDRLNAPTIWDRLSDLNKRVFVMNVPLTYPPKKINGIQICGFLGNDISKGTFPPEIGTILKARGYQIDANTELAKKDLDAFYDHLLTVLDKRIETMWNFWDQENWDFFMTHIMETDRLHHFFWEYMENDHPKWALKFYEFYNKIDLLIGDLIDKIPDDMPLMILSDHGFTTLKKEVYLNRWLWEAGYLKFNKEYPSKLVDLHQKSNAYSLYPGRIYINLKGREKTGSVSRGLEYEQVRQELKSKLLQLTDPETKMPIIKEVLFAEELNNSKGEKTILVNMNERSDSRKISSPDLIAIAHDGYDLKGNLWNHKLFDKTVFNGMHTFNDAFVLFKNGKFPSGRLAITDLADAIYDAIVVES